MAEENTQEGSSDIRRKAAVRLGIAAVVTVLALAALWWLDQSGKEKPKSKATAPIVSAPAPTPPAPPEPAEPEPSPAQDKPAETGTEAPPPPPEVGKPPAPKPARTEPGPTRPASEATPRREPSAPAPVPAGGDYVVQLGVFSNPANAQELVERLKKQGISAYTETRVHVGPFKNKAEAEKAQAELKKMGISGLIGATK